MKISLTKAVVTFAVLLLIVVGAFSAPNTKAKKGKPPTPGVADCSKIDDANLTAQVSAKISGTPSLAGQDINMEAKAGVVTLRGTVSSSSNKQIAGRAAASVKCVKRVVNLLAVTRPVHADYICCCNGECWYQSARCPPCSRIKTCVEDHKAAVIAAAGNKKALAEARDAFHACACRESQ